MFGFLLISLNIQAILQESTIYRRREQLTKITDGLGLGDAYGATIERIRAQGGGKLQLGMEVLMWISYAERPLSADELCHALAVQLGSKDFNAGNIPSMATVVNCCQGLITMDKEASTVRLIHFTLKQYLSAHHYIFGRPHSAMAEICLTYLNSEHVKSLSLYPTYDARETTFLGYCSVYWGIHAKRQISGSAISLALGLFQEYDGPGHILRELLLDRLQSLDGWHFSTYFPFSGLHCASFFGIVDAVATLIDREYCNLNEGDFGGYTPLSWAACNGHEEVVKILLKQEEVNPDKPSNDGETPLVRAVLCGHGEVIRALLEHDGVNPDKPNDHGCTPLAIAAQCGHEEVVKMLLGCEGVNPDKPGNHGRTPLSYAAENGHESAVKLLLQVGVNPDKPNRHSSTPLSYAAQRGHEAVVEILLGREGVNPEHLDNDGDTPLACAAIGRYEGVVKILLEQEGVNPDNLNYAGETPLSIAAQKGHPEVVKILLKLDTVNSNKADNDGRTPLMHAARYGHQRVIELLQHHEAVTHSTLPGLGDTISYYHPLSEYVPRGGCA